MSQFVSSREADRVHFEERLRQSLAGAFQTDPLLVSEELLLHGPYEIASGDKFQAKALALLRADPTIAEAERAALLPLGPEVWEEASSRIEAHLESEPSIPERDLAVYSREDISAEESPDHETLDQLDEIARLALAAGGVEIGAAVEEQEPEREPDVGQGLDPSAALEQPQREPDSIPPAEETADLSLPPTDAEPVEWDLAAAMDPSRLTPLPLVAAALEAVGLDDEQFGFLLRYGTLAPAGRDSEIKIAGMGMADFSHRAAEWFNALGASKFPVQVIDDGSGQLTVYLLDAVPG